MDIVTFEKLRAKYLKNIKKLGRSLMKEKHQAIFDAIPELYALKVTGYTPYFNDGEPCVYSIGEYGFFFSKEEADTMSVYDASLYDVQISHPELFRKYEDILTQFTQNLFDDEIYRQIFGDHVEITFKRNNENEIVVTTEEYDHD